MASSSAENLKLQKRMRSHEVIMTHISVSRHRNFSGFASLDDGTGNVKPSEIESKLHPKGNHVPGWGETCG